jgi:hypothetical protein
MWLFPIPAIIAAAGWIYVFKSAGSGPIAFGVLTLAAGAAVFLVRAGRKHEWPFVRSAVAT